MSTYLNSPSLPFLLHFPAAEPTEVAAAVRDWVSRGQVFTVAITAGESTDANRFLVINFASASCLTVHDQDMFDGLPDETGAATYIAFLKDGGLELDTGSLLAHSRGKTAVT